MADDTLPTSPSAAADDARAGAAAGGATVTPLGYAPPPSGSRFRRWLRDTFTREQIVSGIKQFLWVAPLTVLIWIYAEREQQIPARDVRFNVELRSNNPRVAVRLLDPVDGTVSVDLRGARSQLDDLRSDLGSRSSAVRFEVPADLKDGTHQFPVTMVVNRDVRFEGMSVTNSSPTRITVLVDPIDEETVPVSLRDEDKPLFDAPVFNPPNVKVRMPRTSLQAAKEKTGGKLVVHADLGALPDKTPGRKTDVSGVRVYVPNADPAEVTIEPATVTASLVVRERAKEYTIRELPILEMPANRLRELVSVKQDPVNLFNVRVVGPPEAIAEVERLRGANVKAFVSIDNEDVDIGPHRKEVQFWTPPGVKVHPDDAKQTVEITVTSRQPSP